MRVNKLAENLHANLPTAAADYERTKHDSEDADPVAGDVAISVLPGHVISAGGKNVTISSEAMQAAVSSYSQISSGGLNRIYAIPDILVDGRPAALRMAKDRGMVVGEVTEALVASVLVDAYQEEMAKGQKTPGPGTFAPIPIIGLMNVPTAIPGVSHGSREPSQRIERAGILMPLIEGQNLDKRVDAGKTLSSDQTRNLVDGYDQWIDVAAAQGYVHTDLKPANLMISEDGNSLTPIDHTIIGITRLVDYQCGIKGPSPKTSPAWSSHAALARGVDRFLTHGDEKMLAVDLGNAQRAIVARIALTAFLGESPIPQDAYAGISPFYTAINTPKAYEPALAAAQRRGLDVDVIDRLRDSLQKGLVADDGEAPAARYFK